MSLETRKTPECPSASLVKFQATNAFLQFFLERLVAGVGHVGGDLYGQVLGGDVGQVDDPLAWGVVSSVSGRARGVGDRNRKEIAGLPGDRARAALERLSAYRVL